MSENVNINDVLQDEKLMAMLKAATQNTSAIDHNEIEKPPMPLVQTSFTDLQEYAKGTLVPLPPFAEGQPFVARLRRPSMLALAKSGKIPNSLLSTATELFTNGSKGLDADDETALQSMFDVMETICQSALIAPTWDEIQNAGITLSDDQLMAIFNYTQVGVESLKPFRQE